MDPDPLPLPAFAPARRELTLALGLTAALGFGCAALLLLPDILLRGQRLAPNVHIEGIPVGRLSAPEASRVLAGRFAHNQLTLTADGRATSFDLGTLGEPQIDATVAAVYSVGRRGGQRQRLREIIAGWRNARDFPLSFAFDDSRLLPQLRQIAWKVNRPPVNARLEFIDGALVAVTDRAGVRMEVGATAARLKQTYSLRNTTIAAELKTAPPRISAADLAGVNTSLVTFSTWYRTGESNRSRNIRLCVATLNGRVLMPGDAFSFNKAIGDRTRERGFLLAGMFVNGEKVQGYGGGVCQVSSTVYNAARNADLQILERHPHSLPVPYVPAGRDATVAYPYSDFRFRNSADTPLLVQATASGGRLTVRLWGRADAKIDRSEETARLRVVKYPEKKKAVPARSADGGAPPPAAAGETVPPPPETAATAGAIH